MIKSSFYAGSNYESPAVSVLIVCSEGVLCSSDGGFGSGIDELPEADFDWSEN